MSKKYHPIVLYPNGFDGSKMTVQDMRELARFNRICINYIKMCRLLEEDEEKDTKVAK